jgi:hypothetical protein
MADEETSKEKPVWGASSHALIEMVGMAFFLFQRLTFGGSGRFRSRRVIRFVQVNLLGAGLA